MNDRGWAWAGAMALVLFLSALGGAIELRLGALAGYERRVAEHSAQRAGLEREARGLADLMAAGLERDADSPRSPLWPRLAAAAPGAAVGVRDLSSGLNLNFVRRDLLEDEVVSRLIGLRAAATDLSRYRWERGLSSSLSHYAAFFDLAPGRLVTCYGWANLNTADELALRLVCASVTLSDEGARFFQERIQSFRLARRVILREELAEALGAESLFPFVCAEPEINVNYVDPALASALIAFPAFGIAEPNLRCAELLAARELGAIGESDIERILKVDRRNPILQHLGSRTWFWELSLRRGELACVLVLARLPGAESSGRPGRMKIVETRFEE